MRKNKLKNSITNIKGLASDLKIMHVPISQIKSNPDRPWKTTPKQIEKISLFISKTKYQYPILVDRTNNEIIVGEEWYEAAKVIGLESVQILYADTLRPEIVRLFHITYYKTISLGKWDVKKLAQEFQFLAEYDLLRETGFDLPETDFTLSEAKILSSSSEADIIPEVEHKNPVSKKGDIWLLDNHILLNDDALCRINYERLLQEYIVHAVICDPPFNQPMKKVSGLGKAKHREFVQASGELSEAEFIHFLYAFLLAASEFLIDGGLIYAFMDAKHQFEILTAARQAELPLVTIITWIKSNGGMGSFYRSQTEFCNLFKKGRVLHKNNIQLGKYGRYRTNAWHYDGMNTFRKDRMDDLAAHPTVKPTEMIADAIMDCTDRGQHVLDPFAGSGTIFLACEKTQRRGFGIELDSLYCDVAIRRWQNYTGKQAVHAETGLTFSEHEKAAPSFNKKEVRRARER